MSRSAEDQIIVKSFAGFLNRTTGRIWTPSEDEVPNPTNNRKPDCEFTSNGCRPIMADIFRLFPGGSEQALHSRRNGLISKLTAELVDQGIGGLYIETPFPEKKHINSGWYKKVARQFHDLIARDPTADAFEVDGMHARRCGAPDEQNFFGYHWISTHQPIEAAGYPLVAVLAHKNEQIAVPGHDRYLIGTMRGMPVKLEEVRAACAFIDFAPFPNIDRIYFEIEENSFRLVYDCEAREAMERGELPSNDEQRRLIVAWIEALMSFRNFRSPSGLELALRISWNQGGREWLSPGGRELLELECHLWLQNCLWGPPRAYWEIHKGPVPLIGDGRRRVQTIRVPAA